LGCNSPSERETARKKEKEKARLHTLRLIHPHKETNLCSYVPRYARRLDDKQGGDTIVKMERVR